MQMFPTDGIFQSEIDEYNRQTTMEIEHIRDFIILHYHVTNRRDTPFWRDCAGMDVPPSLRRRIDLFADSGRVFRLPNELFAENSWVQVVLGQGIHPRQHHQSADVMGDDELRGFSPGSRARSTGRWRSCRGTRRMLRGTAAATTSDSLSRTK
jgi:tryptophan halogenase